MSVVDFPKAERLIWTCGHCGCSTFYLYNDQTSECAGCNHVSEAGEWVTPLEDKPKSPEKTNTGSVSTIAIGSVEFAKRRVLKRVADNANELAMVAAWFSDGGMTNWSDISTVEQRDGAVARIHELATAIAAKQIVDDE